MPAGPDALALAEPSDGPGDPEDSAPPAPGDASGADAAPDRAPRGGGRPSVQFDGLRLNGFKSFPETAEIRFEPGLTGIVGPNGCGKSNLLEGLRWAMGETSPRRMRGASMDDMIFNGTEERPPRNVADVTIYLSGSAEGIATDGEGRIEVTRRIERGQGTRYRINGKDALQRTVQVLFQDNAVGTSSAAIISQGRVTALMLAKPSERRGVLEDAAGVGGLNTRRQDYLRKIAGVQENLARADAELSSSGAVLTTLRRQARQAQRHREIGQRVREAAALALHLRHAVAAAAEAEARARHEANESRVAAAMLAAAQAGRERDEAAAALAPARDARIAAEGRVARAEARVAGLAREIERVAQALSAARLRVIEATADGRRIEGELAEAEERARGLREERVALAAERAEEGDAIEAASEAVEAAREAVAAADAGQEAAGRALAEAEAARKAAERALAEASRRAEAAQRRHEATAAALREALARDVPEAELVAAATTAAATADRAAVADETALDRGREAEVAAAAVAEADEAHDRARALATRLRAEGEGLRSVRLAAPAREPVLARLRVEPGWEAAVAAALGPAALAGTDSAEGAWWQAGAARPAPAGVPTLADVAGGVPEIEAFLASVLLHDGEMPEPPAFGYARVTQAGRLARWDGFRRSGGEDAVRAALERGNRLAEIEAELGEAEVVLSGAAARRDAARAGLATAREREVRARAAAREAAEAARTARAADEALRARHADADRIVAAARAGETAAAAERAEAEAALGAARAEADRLPADEGLRKAAELARARVAAAREREAQARALLGRTASESAARKARIDACVREEAVLARRVGEAKERRADLGRRLDEARDLVEETLRQQEAMSETGVAEAQDEHDAARAAATGSREAEAAGEARRERADAAWREAEAGVGGLREERARLLGEVGLAARECEEAVAAIASQLGCGPGEALGLAGLPEGAELPDAATAAARLARLERERDSLGEINFLAEQELAEQEARFGGLERDRGEMRETLQRFAVALRRIEDEARGRLRKAFAEIDGHFGRLFGQLFGGGMAHLRLVGSEDLLEAGLEVYASPPGKRLQILSLLSGGEQALTAMALVFAAFLANPAPICICDEIDAALDDVNVDSLVSLMETMAQGDATRFLCITHRPLMMARMQRLYGVTMMERGVTSVTRVDLDRAIEIAPQPARD